MDPSELEILYLITARGGSKGVPGKNLRRISGLSLVGFKAISARRSKYCSRLVISTDSPEIQEEAARHDVEVPFTRPAELASDTASSDAVVLHAIDYFETVEKRRYDAIMLLEPASPFARAADYDAAVKLFCSRNATMVVGMREATINSVFVGPLGPDGRADNVISKFCDRTKLRRQDFEQEYTMNGVLYLFDWNRMKQTGRIYNDPEASYGYPMDRFYSAEIDTLYDLRLAEIFVETADVDMRYWR